MPHCIIEYSSDLDIDAKELLPELHRLLSYDGEVKVANIKSRLIPVDDYFVNQGNETFAALTVKILPGRKSKWKSRKGKELLQLLKSNIDADKLSVEMIEMDKDLYFKS